MNYHKLPPMIIHVEQFQKRSENIAFQRLKHDFLANDLDAELRRQNLEGSVAVQARQSLE